MKNYQAEAHRTRPDYVVYIPKSDDRSTGSGDTGNEHFLVEPLADGRLFAVWTQSTSEGQPDQHIVIAYSKDQGRTWTAPKTIASRNESRGTGMTSWAFPLISKRGRIYVIYNRHVGINDIFTHTTGLMACIYSDDTGQTWSEETTIPMPRSIWDNPDKKVPANWIVWQKPQRFSDGRYLTGFTRWVSPSVRPKTPRREWWAEASVVEFMRFENIDKNPAPGKIKISYFMANERALRVGLVGYPHVPMIQEPSLVELPDKRLFCVMRTTLGSPHYSISSDGGENWSDPLPLRYHDDGPVMSHPCSPCPIYRLDKGNYIFLYHNHNGYFQKYTPSDSDFHRRPICLARGAFRPKAKQPVWFSEPWFFMDNGGVPIFRADLAMYSSVTPADDGLVLWYPDRKFFLLGKKISGELVRNLSVPE